LTFVQQRVQWNSGEPVAEASGDCHLAEFNYRRSGKRRRFVGAHLYCNVHKVRDPIRAKARSGFIALIAKSDNGPLQFR
jgi:hypothetical protein